MDAIDDLKSKVEIVCEPAEMMVKAGLCLLCGLAGCSHIKVPLSILMVHICVAAPQHMHCASVGAVRCCLVEAAVQACERWIERTPFMRDLASSQVGICARVHTSALNHGWI